MLSRRAFLKLGGGALGFAARGLPAFQSEPKKVRGIIWLWMDGGMQQVHTWDPKPRVSKEIGTPLEGIKLSELLPTCASQIGHLSIVRSLSHRAGDHAVASKLLHTGVITSSEKDTPPIGTILAYELAKKDNPLPPFLTIGPPDIPRTSHFEEEFHPFPLWSVHDPIPYLRRNVESTRDQDRFALLFEQTREWAATRQQPVVWRTGSGLLKSEEVMNSSLIRAFNIHLEPEELRREYGDGFGQQCLLARRLIEVGCPFIEIGLGGWGGWAWKSLIPALDQGIGTLVRDLAQKNLLGETLLVCATEFGKVPQGFGMAPQPDGFSVVLAGGALAGGRVIGDTGPEGMNCKSRVSVKDLFATIYKACGVDPEKTYELEGRKIKYLDGGKPLNDLF